MLVIAASKRHIMRGATSGVAEMRKDRVIRRGQDRAYFMRRAAQERSAADHALVAEAKQAHEVLAERYKELVEAVTGDSARYIIRFGDSDAKGLTGEGEPHGGCAIEPHHVLKHFRRSSDDSCFATVRQPDFTPTSTVQTEARQSILTVLSRGV